MKSFSFLFVVLFCNMLCFSEDDAMFGLSWKMSPTTIRDMGISLSKIKASNNLSTYKTDSLPKQPSVAQSYSLIFDGDTSLVKIIMYSTLIYNDPYGTQGKLMFDNLANLMKNKYTVGKTYCRSGAKLYQENDEFYQCLKYDGCGMWASFFSNENKSICLELSGIERGTGLIQLTVESIPLWQNALDAYKNIKNKSDSEAF